SPHKLIEKLPYAENVDIFVFAFPQNCLSLYRKQKQNFFAKKIKQKCFPYKFNSKKLYVWLLDIENRRIIKKARFSDIFNVERKARTEK
ncbi:MAG: hypothetical protein J7L14_01680, partial [Candidatus Diapherotrites archaeon]|nr:hypothetical protein [Candidatus Diapherotrites archaeon]